MALRRVLESIAVFRSYSEGSADADFYRELDGNLSKAISRCGHLEVSWLMPLWEPIELLLPKEGEPTDGERLAVMHALRDLEYLTEVIIASGSSHEDILKTLVVRHQDLLAVHRLEQIVRVIPRDVQENEITRYLQAVVYYDKESQPGFTRDGRGALELFSKIHPCNRDVLKFWVANYLFLCLRNAGSEFWDQAGTFYTEAWTQIQLQDLLMQQRMIGFLEYNNAVHHAKNLKRPMEAVHCMKVASRGRLAWCKAVLADKSATLEAQISAATQAWKIREGWERVVGSKMIEKCAVTQEYADMLDRKGLVRKEFAVKK